MEDDFGAKAISWKSKLWSFWDPVILLLFMYDYYQLVGRFTFEIDPNWTHYIIMSAVVLVEIVFNFLRADKDAIDEERTLKFVSKNYFTGWFFLDLLASIHLELYLESHLLIVKIIRLR
jgi:hypothetical protein